MISSFFFDLNIIKIITSIKKKLFNLKKVNDDSKNK